MRWLKRLVLASLLALVLGIAGFVAGGLLSLDWERQHAARTAALPVFAPELVDGLVRISAGGMTFRARVAGLDNPGPGVIFLHGFPATSLMWESLIEEAVAAGYPTLAFDQRGYSPGARPEGVEAYAVPELVGDVLAIADAAGFERFHLVGHDWGCVVGWATAILYPERVLSWSGMSIPHPGTLLADLRRELPAYIRVFTAPWLPELMLSFNGMARLRESYEAMTPEQREEYVAVFSEPGALTGGLNWYRAITSSMDTGEDVAAPVKVTTLFIWGTREGWVTPDALARQRTLVAGPYEELELDAGHWVLEEQPDAVAAAVMAHLLRADAEATAAR